MTRGFDPGAPPGHSHALAPEEIIRWKVKAELRKRMRGVRKTTPIEACAARSARIVERLTPLLDGARAVALFWPILERHEVDLRAVDVALRTQGTRVAYPSIEGEDGERSPDMVFRQPAAADALEERGHGFCEPPPDAPLLAPLDVIVVPALAVDPTGHRIGYGAGYYDRALPKNPHARAIAVAYDWQLVAEVPFLPGDVRVGWVVTDQRLIVCDPAGA